MTTILHLIRREAYEARPAGEVVVECPAGAFIHCTGDTATLRDVANGVFRETPGDFLVLVIETARLTAELRWEPPEPMPPAGSPLAGQLFPHLFGDLNADAVVEVRPAQRAPNGEFLET